MAPHFVCRQELDLIRGKAEIPTLGSEPVVEVARVVRPLSPVLIDEEPLAPDACILSPFQKIQKFPLIGRKEGCRPSLGQTATALSMDDQHVVGKVRDKRARLQIGPCIDDLRIPHVRIPHQIRHHVMHAGLILQVSYKVVYFLDG